MLKASPLNKFVHHPNYAKVLHIYNETLQREGKVSNLQFYNNVVIKEMPDCKQDAWYRFLRRFKSSAGIIAVNPNEPLKSGMSILEAPSVDLAKTLLTNSAATAKFVSSILNISAEKADEIIKDPSKLTPKEAIELGIKIMKAQDSRIHAVGKLREDNREQERFDRAFDTSSFEGE